MKPVQVGTGNILKQYIYLGDTTRKSDTTHINQMLTFA
jgi:hypothetical protein